MSCLAAARLVRGLLLTALALVSSGILAAQQYQQFLMPPHFYGGTPIAVADFNGDGKDDLLEATDTGQLQVALSTGKTFITMNMSGSETGVAAVGDFNGDGNLDIAVACAGAASGFGEGGVLSILLGNGDGTFQPHIDFSIPSGIFSIALADLNHDGKLDVVIGVTQMNVTPLVSVLLGNGDGTFQTHVDYVVGPTQIDSASPISVMTADLNGDQKVDVLVVTGSLGVLFGNGDGTLQQPVEYPYLSRPGPLPRATKNPKERSSQGHSSTAAVGAGAVGDFNGDGKLDLAIISPYSIAIFLNQGNGSMQGPAYYTCVSGPSIVTADFNGDGKLDLAAVNPNDDSVSVLFGNGDGTFQPCITYKAAAAVSSLAVGDFNGDGKPDLVTDTTLFFNNGDGTFPSFKPFPVSGAAAMVVADFNGDGIPDLVTADAPFCLCAYSASVSVLPGNGDGTYGKNIDSHAAAPLNLAAGDFNGDGKMDLVTVSYLSPQSTKGKPVPVINVLLGNGDGTFQPPVSYSTAAIPWSVAVGDFNGDGKLDLAFANVSSNLVSVLLGNGDGTFGPLVNYPTAYGAFFIAVGDFNNDGKLDIATAGATNYFGTPPGQVTILLGNGDGSFQPHKEYPVGQALGLVVADLNGDGNQDLVVANGFPTCSADFSVCNNDSSVSVLMGNGDGTFKNAVNYATALGPYGVAVADLNGDGKLDIVTANPQIDFTYGGAWGNTISVLWGNGDGTFRPHLDYFVGGAPDFPAIVDLNGGSKKYVVAALASASEVVPLLDVAGGPANIVSITEQAPTDPFGPPTVLAIPGFSNCPGCNFAFLPDTAVTLTPETPLRNFLAFDSWTGDCTGTSNCRLNTSSDESVTATFITNPTTYTLTVNTSGSGNGQPTAQVGYISCLAAPWCAAQLSCNGNVCSASYPSGMVVAIGALPDPVSTFAGWSGAGCTAQQIDCIVTMNSDATVTATFKHASGLQELTVVVTGSGYDIITSTPGNINCSDAGGTCVMAYATGTQVTLTAQSRIGESLSWSGAGCSGSGNCVVAMTSDQTATATVTGFPDFGMGIQPSLSPNPMTAGQTAQGGVSLITGDVPFTATINLTCSVQPAPQFGPQCTVSPMSSTVGGAPVTITITTTAPQTAAFHGASWGGGLYAIWSPALILLCAGFGSRRYSLRRNIYSVCLAGVVSTVALTISCGGGNSGSHGGSPGTPAGKYQVLVTGTSGATQHSTTVNLTVQ